ncbi:MAG: lycopene cyclase domain-containing protein [Anaerolineae bacterium]
MTYAAFLVQFLVVPIVILGVLVYRDRRRPTALTHGLLSPPLALAALAVIAVVYTTLWDNHLVATGIWRYDPALVMGITLGWVPLEEYLFFILQPLLTGLGFLLLARRISTTASFRPDSDSRIVSALVVSIVWLTSVALLLVGWKPGRYLSLELAWALPPIALQLAVGADILWRFRRVVVPSIVMGTLYLCGADWLAIRSGTWTINAEYSLGVLVGGVLPIEEIIFFLVTNVLLVFGLTLALAQESLTRLPSRITGKLTEDKRLSSG